MQFIVAMAMSVTVRWSSRQFVVVHILGKTEVRNIYISLFHIISSLEKQIPKTFVLLGATRTFFPTHYWSNLQVQPLSKIGHFLQKFTSNSCSICNSCDVCCLLCSMSTRVSQLFFLLVFQFFFYQSCQME